MVTPFRAALIGLSLLAAPALAAPALAAPPTASVTGGTVMGLSSADGAVTRFLGIPFAAPPTAGNRWRPPQPVVPWQGTLETTSFAPACPQPLPPPGSFYQREFFRTSERQSEDCLYLNVTVPPHAPGDRLPVMVWFFGGGFVQGSGSLPSFDGDALARRGVVLVAINYRLGPLGFLALPALDAESPHHVSGNYGLLDEVAALDWVHANIAAFGGDPASVTIFGQSAGALGVGAMMASPLAHGLLRRAISESDPMFGMNDPMQTLAQAEAGGARFLDALKVSDLRDLRLLPAATLVQAMGTGAVGFGLRPNVDGWILPHDLPEIIAAGHGNADALLIGTNHDEGTQLLKPTTSADLAALIGRRFGAQADALAALYRGSDDAAATVAQNRLQSDYLLATAAAEAGAVGRHGTPAYLYRFTRAAPGSDPQTVGAFHSAELAYVFATQASIDRPWAERDRALAAEMGGYWTNFARAGDPNGPGLPNWPRFDAAHPALLELGDTTTVVPVLDPQKLRPFDAYIATRLPRMDN